MINLLKLNPCGAKESIFKWKYQNFRDFQSPFLLLIERVWNSVQFWTHDTVNQHSEFINIWWKALIFALRTVVFTPNPFQFFQKYYNKAFQGKVCSVQSLCFEVTPRLREVWTKQMKYKRRYWSWHGNGIKRFRKVVCRDERSYVWETENDAKDKSSEE